MQALDALPPHALPANLDAPLPNGMTPMALAVQARKPAAAEWLAAHGATLDILHAWDLGWKARARRLSVDFPELVNRRTGIWQITPLHEAAARGDMTLVRLLLKAGADFRSPLPSGYTPLFFAVREGRSEAVRVLLKAGADVNEGMQPNKTGGRAPARGTSPLKAN